VGERRLMAKDAAGRWIGYGPGDTGTEVTKIEHRLLAAYSANSHAKALGVKEDGLYTDETAAAVKELATFINNDPELLQRMAGGQRLARAQDLGVSDLAFRKAIGAYIPPDAAIRPGLRTKYPIQGVWADSRAFLNPPDAHSFEKATNDFRDEFMRLYRPMAGSNIWLLGYSMGGVSVCKCLNALPPEWRRFVVGTTTFGDPSMPAEGSLLGNDPGEGISKMPQPQWVWDRYWSYSIDGDWYPRARGLLFLLYDILVKAELTLEFATFLLQVLPTLPGRILTGQAPAGDDPQDQKLHGVLAPLATVISTGGPNVIGGFFPAAGVLAALPTVIWLLFDAVKFIATSPHGMYGDPAHAFWDGMTAVDHAAANIRRVAPNGCTLFLLPGTWSNWDQLFQFDVAIRLQGA
jgi:hypothetical protein